MSNQIRNFNEIPENAKLYFIGIGGISMCGLAEITYDQGYRISGSDMHASEHTDHLIDLGIPVIIGQTAYNIDKCMPDLVIYSAAVPLTNVEIVRAQELGITVIERGLFLGWITREFNRVVNVAGTHGKTTTTAMIAMMLLESRINPTIHLGAKLSAFGNSTVHIGESGKLLVSEACEYHNSFLNSISTTATVLNIDADHLDYFGSIETIIETFAEFATQIHDDGWLILPHNGAYMDSMLAILQKRNARENRGLPPILTFGPGNGNGQADSPDVCFCNVSYINGLPDFDVYYRGEFLLHVHLNIPGEHNIYNAVAAIACALVNGADAESIATALGNFKGADGRFSLRGEYRSCQIIVDYAHHPTAVSATLSAAETIPHSDTWVIFQPLTFNRTKILFDEFVEALKSCKNLLLVEIFSDRELDDLGMSSRLLVEAINKKGGNARFCNGYVEVKGILDKSIHQGDLLLFLGPEDVRNYGARLMTEN